MKAVARPREMTERQNQVLDYLRVFLALNHQLPPCSHIAREFGWRSPNAANETMQRLERAGLLARNELGNLMLAPAAFEDHTTPTAAQPA